MLPEGRGDGILEFQSSWLSINFQGHHVHIGVIELDPCDMTSIGTEPEGASVGDDLLFIDPVGDSIEDGAGNP